MDLKVSPVYLANHKSEKRIVINQGGTRSGKTYSILQVLIIKYGLMRKGLIIDIARKTQREIKETVFVDFIEILKSLNLFNEKHLNKTSLEYHLNGNTFRFLGMDKAQKKRGSKRDVLYCNEANGLTLDDWIQLSVRTTEKIYIDFNPSEYFWVNEHIMEQRGRDDWELIVSTYLDNYEFLPESQIKDIENLIHVDDFYYKVYVLGELGIMRGKIYENYKVITPDEYDRVYEDFRFYGLDFGYEHATVLTEIKWANEQTFERCIYFEKRKFDDDLIKFMDKQLISFNDDIYADPAVPTAIRKIRDAGYTVHKAKKDVIDGIRFCQSLKRNICSSSVEYIRQMDKYKLKQLPDGTVIDGTPVKLEDDGPDAFRYGAFNKLRTIYNPMGI